MDVNMYILSVIYSHLMFFTTKRIIFQGNCRIQPTVSSLTKDSPNPNHYPNPNVRIQDWSSRLAAVW